jgi:hypothetical protein
MIKYNISWNNNNQASEKDYLIFIFIFGIRLINKLRKISCMNLISRNLSVSVSKVSNHPWLMSTSPPRRMQNSLLGMLKERFLKTVAVERFQNIIPGYDFPRQFLEEASVTTAQVFQILSDAEKQTHAEELSKVMAGLLANAFSKGNQELREKDQIPKWTIHGNPKLNLLGVHSTVGPYPPPEGYEIQHVLPFMSLIVPQQDLEFVSHQRQVEVIEEAKEHGMFMRINVRLMNNVDFVCLKQDVEVFKDTRPYVDLEFMSPHFNPYNELHYLDSDGEWHLNWEWRLSDVDFFLQCQMQ